jgi:hypothetical protein
MSWNEEKSIVGFKKGDKIEKDFIMRPFDEI